MDLTTSPITPTPRRNRRWLLGAAGALVLGLVAPVAVHQGASATDSIATISSDTVDYRVVPKRTLLLNPPVDDPYATDQFVPLGAGTADRLEFDGTDANIKCRTTNHCTLRVAHRAGLGEPWFNFLDLRLERLEFSVDADGTIVDSVVEGWYTVEYENWDEDLAYTVHRPLVSVDGSFVDDEFFITFNASFETGGPDVTVAEMVLAPAPPPSGGGGPSAPPPLAEGTR